MLPPEVRKRTTVWVSDGQRLARPIRYGVDGESLVCFGDDGLADVPAGSRVSVTLHELHDGPPLLRFDAVLRDLSPSDVSLGMVAEIVGHRSHVESYDEIRRTRRIVALAS